MRFLGNLALAVVAALAACGDDDVPSDLALDLGTDAAILAPCIDAAGVPVSTDAGVTPTRRPGSCTADDIDAYVVACLDRATALVITCQQYTAAHGACTSCLLRSDGSGPLREHPGGVDANLAGCVELERTTPSSDRCYPCVDDVTVGATLRAIAPLFCL